MIAVLLALLAGAPASPQAIVGSWRMGCPDNDGMVVEFAVDRDKAIGKVVEPGKAAKYGYRKGEEMFHLSWDPHGDWLGEVRWRGVSGAQHWDSIRMAAAGNTLTATMTNESCYKNMARVR
jgi:hypothetical protein